MAYALKEIELLVRLRVTGDVAIPIKWGKRDFFPRDAHVNLIYRRGQELLVNSVSTAGPIVKKDGLPGEAWSRDNTYWTRDGQFGDDAPDLIREIAESALLTLKEHWK